MGYWSVIFGWSFFIHLCSQSNSKHDKRIEVSMRISNKISPSDTCLSGGILQARPMTPLRLATVSRATSISSCTIVPESTRKRYNISELALLALCSSSDHSEIIISQMNLHLCPTRQRLSAKCNMNQKLHDEDASALSLIFNSTDLDLEPRFAFLYLRGIQHYQELSHREKWNDSQHLCQFFHFLPFM